MLLHSTGRAVGFADQLIGLRKFIGDVAKAKMLSGLPLSSLLLLLPNSGRQKQEYSFMEYKYHIHSLKLRERNRERERERESLSMPLSNFCREKVGWKSRKVSTIFFFFLLV